MMRFYAIALAVCGCTRADPGPPPPAPLPTPLAGPVTTPVPPVDARATIADSATHPAPPCTVAGDELFAMTESYPLRDPGWTATFTLYASGATTSSESTETGCLPADALGPLATELDAAPWQITHDEITCAGMPQHATSYSVRGKPTYAESDVCSGGHIDAASRQAIDRAQAALVRALPAAARPQMPPPFAPRVPRGSCTVAGDILLAITGPGDMTPGGPERTLALYANGAVTASDASGTSCVSDRERTRIIHSLAASSWRHGPRRAVPCLPGQPKQIAYVYRGRPVYTRVACWEDDLDAGSSNALRFAELAMGRALADAPSSTVPPPMRGVHPGKPATPQRP